MIKFVYGVWSALILDLFFLAVYIFDRAGTAPIEVDDFTPYFTLATVLVATLALVTKSAWDESEDRLKRAIEMFQSAYSILDKNRTKEGYPSNERRHWFAAARLVVSAEQLASGITEKSHLSAWKAQLLFWRSQFRGLLFPDGDGFPGDYYAESVESAYVWSGNTRAPIDEITIAALYRFTTWKGDEEDPIEGVKPFDDGEINRLPHNLLDFLLRIRDSLKRPN